MDAETLLRRVQREGAVLLAGAAAIRQLRAVLRQLRENAGIEFTFSPDSDPELVDYLLAAGVGALEVGVVSSLVGALVGYFFKAPVQGMVLGGVTGALAGAGFGLSAVNRGTRARWRILVWYEGEVPHALIQGRG